LRLTKISIMNLKELIFKTRSYRRFNESYQIDDKTIESLIDLARLSPSGANKQPLKYLYYNTAKECEKIFPYLAWAGYLTDWPGPEQGERPTAYIIILGDKSISELFGVDHGIAAHSILLGATDAGLGGCIIGSIKRDELTNELSIPDNFDILLILALGKPIENIIIEDIKGADVKYWRDKNKNHHVPKRSLKELIIKP
jgi:nitroreductase